MKKINSINYGYKIICGAAFCIFIIPASCYLFWIITKLSLFQLLAKVFITIGVIILLFLFLLLKIELSQDKKINDYYKANSQCCLPLKSGLFECQTCGNNQVTREHGSCIICGTTFKKEEFDGNKKQY